MANLTCPHCGTANRIGSNFCNKCGTDLREEEAPSTKIDDGTPVDAIARAAELAAEQIATSSPADADESLQERPADAIFDRDPTPKNLEEAQAESEEADPSKPLPPLFDLGLASITASHGDSPARSQPWLPTADDASSSAESLSDSTTAAAPDHDDQLTDEGLGEDAAQAGVRLVGGVQGLLDPLNITSDAERPNDLLPAVLPAPVIDELTAQQIRHMRQTMSQEPVLAAQSTPAHSARYPSLRIAWIFWLLAFAVILPVFGILSEPIGRPQAWPGVVQTFDIVEALPPGADVLIYWAYDPATSGELDLAAEPMIRHLLQQRAELTFVSLLPGGPATVRRLVAKTVATGMGAEMDAEEVPVAVRRITARNFYLTGGASVLPLLGQGLESISLATGAVSGAPSTAGGITAPADPDLVVVMAARAEDVQQWLELVQTVEPVSQRTTVVAVTGAGAEPMAHPYLDSGQLSGLVSGFDGAETYLDLQQEPIPDPERVSGRVQAIAQNWAHLALLFVLLMGNIVGFINRDTRRRGNAHV